MIIYNLDALTSFHEYKQGFLKMTSFKRKPPQSNAFCRFLFIIIFPSALNYIIF